MQCSLYNSKCLWGGGGKNRGSSFQEGACGQSHKSQNVILSFSMIIASRNWRLLINVWFIFRRVHQHCTGTCKTTMGFSFWSKFNDLEARKISFFSFSLRYKYGLCTNTMPSYLIQQTNPALLYSRLWLTINVTTHYSILFNNFSFYFEALVPMWK